MNILINKENNYCLTKTFDYATGRGASTVSSPLPTTKVLRRGTTVQTMHAVVVAELTDRLKGNFQTIRELSSITLAYTHLPPVLRWTLLLLVRFTMQPEVFSRELQRQQKRSPSRCNRIGIWERLYIWINQFSLLSYCTRKVRTDS